MTGRRRLSRRLSGAEKRRRRKSRQNEEQQQQIEEQPGEGICVYCRETDDTRNMITPCNCGDARYWHYECLIPWIVATRDRPCTICHGTRYTDARIQRGNTATRREYYAQHQREARYLVEIILLMLGSIFVYAVYFGLCIHYVPTYLIEENLSLFRTLGIVSAIATIGWLVGWTYEAYNVDQDYRLWIPSRDVVWFRDYNGQQIEPGRVWEFPVGQAIQEHRRQQIEQLNAIQQQQKILALIQLGQQQLQQQQQQQQLPIEEPQEGDEELDQLEE